MLLKVKLNLNQLFWLFELSVHYQYKLKSLSLTRTIRCLLVK